MKKTLILLFFLCFFLSQRAMTNQGIASANDWQCTAQDAENKQWTVKSNYKISAFHKSLEQCRKESLQPKTCRMAKGSCESFINGLTTRPMWQCSALDHRAKVWTGKIYRYRDDAALAAKAYCRQGSALPDTCYINLITCKNLNSRE